MYELKVGRRFLKRLKKLPTKHRGQVWRKVRSLRQDPRPQSSRKLRAGGGYRLTIGEYRALYTIDDDAKMVKVYLLFHRGEDYPDLP